MAMSSNLGQRLESLHHKEGRKMLAARSSASQVDSPQGVEDISQNIEELVDPHANRDEAIGIDDDDGTDVIDDRNMK